MIRKFELINSAGETYDLNDKQHFLYDPSELGYSEGTVYRRADTFYPVEEAYYNQAQPTGNIYFCQPNAYVKYLDFIKFCQLTPLQIKYTTDAGIFYMYVRLSNITKSEIKNNGLDCPVTFSSLGLWYKKTTLQLVQITNRIKAAIFNNGTNMTAPCILKFIGGFDSDLEWNWYVGANPGTGDYVGNGKLINLNPGLDGKKYIINNTTQNYEIYSVDNQNNRTNLYEYSDFSTKRFVTLPNSSIGSIGVIAPTSQSIDVLNSINIELEVHEQYASV